MCGPHSSVHTDRQSIHHVAGAPIAPECVCEGVDVMQGALAGWWRHPPTLANEERERPIEEGS